LKQLSKARQKDYRATAKWGWNSNIRGIGVGEKHVNGERVAGVPCLTIYLRSKLPQHRIPPSERIPHRLRLAATGEEVVTDILQMKGPITAHAASMVQPGVEVAHKLGDRGTLGLLVRKSGSPQVLALSCSHVLARSGVGSSAGDLVEHPLDVFADPEVNRFGLLTDDFTRLNAGSDISEDMALASVAVNWLPALLDTAVVVLSVADSRPGFQSGTTTLLNGIRTKEAHGEIINGTWSGTIHDVPFAGDVDFTNLVSYRTDCQPGDSGAAVMQDGEQSALGLHVGGSPQDKIGVFMPLWPLFDRLKLKLVTTREGL
jgi:hypothetical protein